MNFWSKGQGGGRRRIRLPLVAVCYSIVIVVWLAVSTFQFVTDSIARTDGTLRTQQLRVESFTLHNMQRQPSGAWRSITDDPQMVLEVAGRQVNTLRFGAQFSMDGYEMCVYYTNAPGDEFSDQKRVWPVQQNDGSYLFYLPRGHIERLRLDPASRILDMEFTLIELNGRQGALAYYNPGPAGLAMLLVLPPLAAAALRWMADMWRHYKAYFAGRRWLRKKREEIQAKKREKYDG